MVGTCSPIPWVIPNDPHEHSPVRGPMASRPCAAGARVPAARVEEGYLRRVALSNDEPLRFLSRALLIEEIAYASAAVSMIPRVNDWAARRCEHQAIGFMADVGKHAPESVYCRSRATAQ